MGNNRCGKGAYATAQTSEQEVGLPYTIKYPKTSASDSFTNSATGGDGGVYVPSDSSYL